MKDGMKKVLLVDDDAVLRIGMKTLVDWQQHGYILIGEASDGAQAMELVQQHRPDIVITDMKMPGMDGLELIHALHAETPAPYIIVLSSYDDFPLVREAMKQGAADYLLKLELSPAVLLQSLSHAPEHAGMEKTAMHEQQAKQERVLHDLISHFYLNEQEMQTRLLGADICFSAPHIYCLLVKAGDLFRFEECTEEEYHTLMFSIRNITAEIVGDCMHAYYADGKTGELYVFGEIKEEFDDTDTEQLVNELATRLRSMLAQYLDIPCVIGIGKGESSAGGIAQACRNAADAVRSRFYAKDDGVLGWDAEAGMKTEELPASLYQARRQLARSLEALDESGIHAAMAQVKALLAERRYAKGAVYAIAIELAGTVRDHFEHCGIHTENLLAKSRRDLTELGSFQTVGEVLAWIDALQSDLDHYVEQERSRSGSAIVKRVEEILRKQFSSDINLTGVASELELTPGYISAQMKKQTGMSFSEYLTRLRIDEAKKLLADTDWKVYAVAEAVGYEDAFYFSRIFKRLTGTSPMDWRRLSMQRRGIQ